MVERIASHVCLILIFVHTEVYPHIHIPCITFTLCPHHVQLITACEQILNSYTGAQINDLPVVKDPKPIFTTSEENTGR